MGLTPVKLVSWNVNGIRASADKGLKDFVAKVKPDIICLQETKAHKEQVGPELQTLGYSQNLWSSAEKKGYSGVATFSNVQADSFRAGMGIPEYDREGRIVVTTFGKTDLYNIYFPNGGSGEERHNFKQKFLKELLKHLRGEMKKGRSIILVGDYNVAHKEVDVYDPVRLSKESGFLPEEREWFQMFLDAGFVDCFRQFHPDAKDRYSWWSYREFARASNRGWRIDYICVSKDLASYIKSADILDQQPGSDHCPVIAEIIL